ncbi:UDP-glucuronic acid decarboxylase family protein [Pyramidobacter sp. CG50-2]|uniref:UDP-glucuronic acid decarboxylase family protein n=1 Tax=Pyramidobacter sp. CG50-2 TaxID=2382160 RepID=UPI000EA2876F|nr:UDP-glucuronic acid decarboxylase family protein [Pyramidobacter sp. CG50-2]RKJ76672.1 SDR family oxidoreductase [Pyramidobacter sp. CG50-2]
MKKKRVLVTGGAGFLGSHLCERLLKLGNYVICTDNLFTGSEDNIRHLFHHPHFEFLCHDVISPLSVECDQIYNLACPASPRWYQKDPVYTMKTSFLGALNVLELARTTGARVLQASTSEVYGDPDCSPQPESYRGCVSAVGPRACYDEGKRAAETLFFDYRRQYGLDIKVIRIFNTYGPRMSMDDGRVVSNFIVQALKGEDITIYGSGAQSRSFCYVDDLVAGMNALMNSPGDFTGPVNIGNPEEISIKELAETVIRLTGSQSRLAFKELPVDDPRQRRPDIALAKRELGWSPVVRLEEGLKLTIDYFKRLINC